MKRELYNTHYKKWLISRALHTLLDKLKSDDKAFEKKDIENIESLVAFEYPEYKKDEVSYKLYDELDSATGMKLRKVLPCGTRIYEYRG